MKVRLDEDFDEIGGREKFRHAKKPRKIRDFDAIDNKKRGIANEAEPKGQEVDGGRGLDAGRP